MNCRQFRLLFFGSLICTMAGCGGSTSISSGDSSDVVALKEIGEIYRLYSADHNKPPEKVKDFEVLRPVGPVGVKQLESGEIVLQYGAVMTDTADGPAATASDKVLAFGKSVPESGGQVLLLDRTIKKMTPDEFKAAPKAGK